MSFGTTPDTIVYDIIVMLAALPAGLLLLALGGLLRRLLRAQSGPLGCLVIVLPLAGALLGISLYLDTIGVIVPAQVVKKTETIDFRKEGDWRHQYEVQLQYTNTDGSTPAARFFTTAAVFDALHEGGPTSVRTVSINGWFNLARLADQSTWTWLPWKWLAIGLAVLVLGWLGWQYFWNKTGCALLLLVAVVIFVTPFLLKWIEWRNSMNPSLTPLQTTGLVTKVQRVTEIDPLPGNGGDGSEWETQIEAVQPYDIVVVRYTPPGYAEPILGVDAIDVGSETVTPAMTVAIAYAPTEPRAVRLVQGARSHYWKNPVAWLKQQTLDILLIVALIGAVQGIERWWQWRRKRMTPATNH